MEDYKKIHQHIENILEERYLSSLLPDLFQKHKLISFKVWSFYSFIFLFPLSLCNAVSLKNLIISLQSSPTAFTLIALPDFLNTFLIYLVSFLSFIATPILCSLLLTHFLPFCKLSQKSFFKKYLGKYLRKFPILASSCDTIHYKEELILKYCQDTELNLAMSSYYEYLLSLPFSLEVKNLVVGRKIALMNIVSDRVLYEKNFVSILLNFIHDFKEYSKSSLIIQNNHLTKTTDYYQKIFNNSDTNGVAQISEKSHDDFETLIQESEKDLKEAKKKFKEML